MASHLPGGGSFDRARERRIDFERQNGVYVFCMGHEPFLQGFGLTQGVELQQRQPDFGRIRRGIMVPKPYRSWGWALSARPRCPKSAFSPLSGMHA
jgi:hypothetical protein